MMTGSLQISDLTKSIMEENEAFCQSNQTAREACTEIVELMNDAVDHVQWEAKLSGWDRLFPKFAMLNYLFSVLMPIPYAINLDFLTGNLPACFMQLRTLLEQLAKCCLSDLRYQDLAFFQDKMMKLEAEKVGSTRTIESVEPKAVSLWSRLSNDWIHMKYLNRIVNVVLERGDVPGYGLVIPIAYSETELPEIQELGKSIADYRAMLAKTIEKWKVQVDIQASICE